MFQIIFNETPLCVDLQTLSGFTAMEKNGNCFEALGSRVVLLDGKIILINEGASAENAPMRIRFRWVGDFTSLQSVYHDDWLVGTGALGWGSMQAERVLPFYFMATDQSRTYGCGVKTGCNAFAFWQLDTRGITLWLDVRCGGLGVLLQEPLLMAELVTDNDRPRESAYAFAKRFAGLLCENPRLPSRPVFGTNNWYYAYGNISGDSVVRDAALATSLCCGNLRPYMLIDDGWQKERTTDYNGGPWIPNAGFRDMYAVAENMKKEGCIPGIWFRPLLTNDNRIPDSWKLTRPVGFQPEAGFLLDPSVPEVAEKIRQDVSQIYAWGFRLIKHDFSSYDMLGVAAWNFGARGTPNGWHFADRSKTSAQITKDLYHTIQEAAKDAMVMGCCTVNHLAAGIHEINRSGADTSGRVWEITRLNGINTLAQRLHQNRNFFMTDADCVPFTSKVGTKMSLLFADLISRSGTALFASVTPGYLNKEEVSCLRECYTRAAQGPWDMEPLDWMSNLCPEKYICNGNEMGYDWYTPCRGVRTFYNYYGEIE